MAAAPPPPASRRRNLALLILLLLQGSCAVFFVADILANVIGLRQAPISWHTRELLEIGAALGLLLGVVLGWIAYRRSLQRTEAAEASLRRLQGAFQDHLQQKFDAWRLTPAERDVALFALKGFSIEEIATLRQTSPGTVKAQSNAIYRKAEVSSRPQLLSLFIEDLMAEDPVTPPPNAATDTAVTGVLNPQSTA